MFAQYEPEVRSRRDGAVAVRRAELGDLDAVAAVAASRGPLPGSFRDSITRRLGDPRSSVLVAAPTGAEVSAVAGWAMATPWSGQDNCPDGLYVSALTVAQEWRRRGAGERLLDELMTWSGGRASVLRSVVNARNLPSIVLHERLGFTEVDRGTTFGGITFEGGLGVLLAADVGTHAPACVWEREQAAGVAS